MTATRVIKRIAGWLGRATAALILLVATYIAAGLIGGSIPVNADWRPPASGGVTIVVESNGIHTGFVMPKLAAGVDWRDLARAGDIADPRFAAYDHVAIGWGDKRFFLETPEWRDLRPGTVLGAIWGGSTLLHVEHIGLPPPGPDERYVTLRPEEYRRLAAFIRAALVPGGRRYPGYGANDVFLDATGRYSAIRTCNEWAGEALRFAGVRVGAWTPFTQTVEGWF